MIPIALEQTSLLSRIFDLHVRANTAPKKLIPQTATTSFRSQTCRDWFSVQKSAVDLSESLQIILDS